MPTCTTSLSIIARNVQPDGFQMQRGGLLGTTIGRMASLEIALMMTKSPVREEVLKCQIVPTTRKGTGLWSAGLASQVVITSFSVKMNVLYVLLDTTKQSMDS